MPVEPEGGISEAPSIQEQTAELGKTLKQIAVSDPSGTPTPAAGSAFNSWLSEAGPKSREPQYFRDVAGNYDITFNTNKDLWELFDILSNYIEVEEDSEGPEMLRTFIHLPLAGDH